jgi:restriction system protein
MSDENRLPDPETIAGAYPPGVPAASVILGITFTDDPDPKDLRLTLVIEALIIPERKTVEGVLIKSVTGDWRALLKRIKNDPSQMYQIDPRTWEEIVAGSYKASGQFDEVILTPRSGDRGRDLIAVKKGFGGVRLIESVKRKTPGSKTTAEEVQAFLGVLLSDPQASKGIVSTTWEFAPKITDNPHNAQWIPNRLELVDGTALMERLKEYESPTTEQEGLS